MRILLRLLKRKALSSVNNKRKDDASNLGRSPFAAGPTSVQYIESQSAEASGLKSHKLNALADLALRVSSEAEYEVTSASEFLSETKSMELDEQPEDSSFIPKTSWPFPSFSQPESDTEIPFGMHEHSASKNGGFEFIIPHPITVEESENSLSTLSEWGALRQDSQEPECSNPLLHHYASWGEDQMTPFDAEPVKTQIPLSVREDSAQAGEPARKEYDWKDENDLTLTSLERSIKRAKPGSVLDLGGMHIVDDGTLLITTSDITLQNGTLEMAQGLSITACRVKLQDLTLISKSSKGATLRVTKKGCCLMRCSITNTEGVGVLVTGLGSLLAMQQTTVHDCERSCVCVNRAGTVRIGEGCIIQGSRSFHGISATDPGTELWVENSKICDNFQDGIYVTSSAHAALENCDIFGSRAFHGIAGKKFGTTIVLKHCRLRGFKESGLIVEMGAKAKMTDSRLWKCNKGHGVVADGHGSCVDVLDSEISDCEVGGVLIRGNASGKIARTYIYGSAYGNGVVVSEQGSFAKITNSIIFQNCRHGVLVMEEARVVLEETDVSSSTAGNGILVRNDASATLSGCQMSKNNSSNISADTGGTVHVAQCQLDRARNGPSIVARGLRTSVCLTVPDEALESLQSEVYILNRGKILANERKLKNRQKWPKFKQNNAFSHRLLVQADRK